MTKRKIKIVWGLIAVTVGALLFFPVTHWVQKQALKPLLKPYQTAALLPDYSGIPFYQTPQDPAEFDILPHLGIQSSPMFNCQLKNPRQLKVLSDFIGSNAAFMKQSPGLLQGPKPPQIINSYENLARIHQSLGGLSLSIKFYEVHLENEIVKGNLTGALEDLRIIHQTAIEFAKFPYVFCNYYFMRATGTQNIAISRILNCLKLTPPELTEITGLLNQSESLLPQSFNNAISSAAYFLLFAPTAEKQHAITNRDYPLTYHNPIQFPDKTANYSPQELWQRERFYMKYLAFANTGLFDFTNYRNVEKGWERYQKELKDCPSRKYFQADINLFELYQGNLQTLVELRFAKIAVAVRLFEDKNQRPPASLEELIQQNLITAADAVNPFTGEAIRFEQGVFPVLQEYRYIDNLQQDRYEDCPAIRISCPTLQRTLQYFVVDKIK